MIPMLYGISYSGHSGNRTLFAFDKSGKYLYSYANGLILNGSTSEVYLTIFYISEFETTEKLKAVKQVKLCNMGGWVNGKLGLSSNLQTFMCEPNSVNLLTLYYPKEETNKIIGIRYNGNTYYSPDIGTTEVISNE